MYPEKTDKGRCGQKVKFVGYLMYGQVGRHNITFCTYKNCFVNPALSRMIRDGFDYRSQIFWCNTELICIIRHTSFGFA